MYSYHNFHPNSTYVPPDEFYVRHHAVLPIEQNFDFVGWHQVLAGSFHSWIYFVLLTYLGVIFGLKRFMRDRPAFDLQWPLILWNSTLALFSIMGSIRTLNELFYVWRAEGLEGTICHPGHIFGVTALYTFLFVMSKMPEMVDTVFIVLRKRPLIFLHWYHHVETCYYSIWAYTSPRFPVSRWFISINYTVHAFMYSYYALRAAGYKFPRYVPMTITTAQVSQMFIGMFVIVKAFSFDCYNHPAALYGGLLTYSIYAIMFTNYFVKAYYGGASRHRSRTSKKFL